jgi:hypothetical protein
VAEITPEDFTPRSWGTEQQGCLDCRGSTRRTLAILLQGVKQSKSIIVHCALQMELQEGFTDERHHSTYSEPTMQWTLRVEMGSVTYSEREALHWLGE